MTDTATPVPEPPCNCPVSEGMYGNHAEWCAFKKYWDAALPPLAVHHGSDSSVSTAPPAENPGERLEPCPFCGGAAQANYFVIECGECYAQMSGNIDDDDNIVRLRAAISAWNRRAPLTRGVVGDDPSQPSPECSGSDKRNRLAPFICPQRGRVCTAGCPYPNECPEPAAPLPVPDELVRRLREAEADYTIAWGNGDLYEEAADALEAQRRKIAELTKERDTLFAHSTDRTCTLAELRAKLTQAEAVVVAAEEAAAVLREHLQDESAGWHGEDDWPALNKLGHTLAVYRKKE